MAWYKHGMAAEYLALVVKVEAFVAQVGMRRADDMQCRKGCDACCHAWLSLNPVEAEQVRMGLSALPAEQRARVRERGEEELARELLHAAPARCAMLEEDGSCAIYAFRPLVCRTQGHALRYPEGFVPEEAIRLRTRNGDVTWCPLNYTASTPRSEDVLDAERVDQILALIAQRHDADAEAGLVRAEMSALAAAL